MRALLFGLVLGCGGALESTTPDGSLGDGGPHDARSDQAIGDATGWTTCSSPNGARVCKGPNQCPTSDCMLCESSGSALGICATSTNSAQLTVGCSNLWPCVDGRYCINLSLDYESASEDLVRLFEANDASARLRYADLSDWTGQYLSIPQTCPALPGLRLCGGPCPTCGPGEVCSGRSPLHPYSRCVPNSNAQLACTRAKPQCPMGTQCSVLKVQPDAQALADHEGSCIPTAECLAMASSYPGGAECL